MISKEKASELVFFLKSLSLTSLGGFCCTIIYEMFHYLAGESTPVLFANAFSYCGQILIRIEGTPFIFFAYVLIPIIFLTAFLGTLLGGLGLFEAMINLSTKKRKLFELLRNLFFGVMFGFTPFFIMLFFSKNLLFSLIWFIFYLLLGIYIAYNL